MRGSQARATLFFRNVGKESLNSFKSQMIDENAMLRFEIASTDADFPAGGQMQQQILLECINPVHPGPVLTLEYLTPSNAKRETTLALPITLATFIEPLALSGPDFIVRWNALVSPGQEAVEVFPSATVTPAVAHKVLTAVCLHSLPH